MKGRKLTLQEVLNLEDGSKVWVEDNRGGYSNELCIYNKWDSVLVVCKDKTCYDLTCIRVYEDKLEFYEWIEGKSFSDLWDSMQKAVYEIGHDCYIPLPYEESSKYKMAQEICNLRCLDFTNDNIEKIIKEFSEVE